MLAVPALALMIAPQTAAAIMLPILVMIDMANIWRYRRDWVGRILKILIPASFVGITIGALCFQYLNADMFRLGLGALALTFVGQRIFQVLNDRPSRKPGKWMTTLLGATGGFTSFVAHAGGPPTKMVLLAENLSKRGFMGSNSYLFAAINFLKLFPYFYLGQFSMQNLTVSASLAPFVLAGILVGFWLHGLVSQVWFTRIVFVALFGAGVKLVIDGLAGLM